MGSSTSNTNEQQKTEIDPDLKRMYMQNYADAQRIGQGVTNFGPYDGPRVAGPTEAFTGAADTVSSIAGALNREVPAWAAGNTLNRAEGWLNDVAGYQPSKVNAYGYDPSAYYMQGATIDPAQQEIYTMNREGIRDQTNAAVPRSLIRDVNGAASTVPRELVRDVNTQDILPGMKQYETAYTDAVIGQGTADLDRARKIALQQAGSQAVQQGAFGGGRHGVVESETNRGFADAVQRLTAEERAKAFNTAAGLSGQDVSNRMQAGQANQGADISMAGLRQQGLLTAGQANQQADLAAAAQQLQGGQAAQAANQQMDYNAALAKMQALNTGASSNTDRRMQGLLTNAGYGQDAAARNQQAALDASKFNAAAKTDAEKANQAAGFQNISQLLQAIQQGQSLAGQQYQMPMDAASKLFQLDQYSRGLTNEQIQAAMQAWDDARYAALPGLQLQGGALGMQLPNLGMSSTGSATTKQTQSPMQSLGQLAGLAGLFM